MFRSYLGRKESTTVHEVGTTLPDYSSDLSTPAYEIGILIVCQVSPSPLARWHSIPLAPTVGYLVLGSYLVGPHRLPCTCILIPMADRRYVAGVCWWLLVRSFFPLLRGGICKGVITRIRAITHATTIPLPDIITLV